MSDDDDETEYRIEYTIQRRLGGEDDFSDVGFGSSGAWSDPEQCVHMVSSDVGNFQWENEPGMPTSEEIRAAVESSVR